MTLPDLIQARGCHCGSTTFSHAAWCPVQVAADLRDGVLVEDADPDPPMIYSVKGDERELWVVVAHRAGKWQALEPLTPLSPRRFPFCGNYDEVCERGRLMLRNDPAFRARWWNYYIAGARVDGQIFNGPDRR